MVVGREFSFLGVSDGVLDINQCDNSSDNDDSKHVTSLTDSLR